MADLTRINGDYAVGAVATLADGTRFVVPAMALVDAAGNTAGSSSNPIRTASAQMAYQLAGTPQGAGASLANGSNTSPVAVPGGSYIWSYQFSGTTTLTLQVLGPDGVTWTNFTPAATATATGQQGVVLGNNPNNVPNVRILNSGANPATALFSALS
jgi:hypothetical protein